MQSTSLSSKASPSLLPSYRIPIFSDKDCAFNVAFGDRVAVTVSLSDFPEFDMQECTHVQVKRCPFRRVESGTDHKPSEPQIIDQRGNNAVCTGFLRSSDRGIAGWKMSIDVQVSCTMLKSSWCATSTSPRLLWSYLNWTSTSLCRPPPSDGMSDTPCQ